jgi:hypothetical protein
MATPSQANRIAAAAALLVFLILALVVDRTGDSPEPQTTTTVERETTPAPPPQRVTTSITFANGRRTGSTRTTEVQAAPASPESSTITTTETEPLSAFERVLGNDILTYLIALLAAFLTAAALQRILLGRYGGSRSGGSEELAQLARDLKLELARIYALIAELEKEALRSNGAGSGDGQGEQGTEAQRQVERLAREAFALEGRGGG